MSSHHNERILNDIGKAINVENVAALKVMLQGLRIYFICNSLSLLSLKKVQYDL